MSNVVSLFGEREKRKTAETDSIAVIAVDDPIEAGKKRAAEAKARVERDRANANASVKRSYRIQTK